MVIYILAHILLSVHGEPQGLEFSGLDLPDSVGELKTRGILVIQLERVYAMILHFVQARFQRGNVLNNFKFIFSNSLYLIQLHTLGHLFL